MSRLTVCQSQGRRDSSVFKEDINENVATPVVHALSMTGAYFSKISTQRGKKVEKKVFDHHLAHWLEDTLESLTQFFPQDISSAMEAARTHHMDGLLLLGSRAIGPSSRG